MERAVIASLCTTTCVCVLLVGWCMYVVRYSNGGGGSVGAAINIPRCRSLEGALACDVASAAVWNEEEAAAVGPEKRSWDGWVVERRKVALCVVRSHSILTRNPADALLLTFEAAKNKNDCLMHSDLFAAGYFYFCLLSPP